MSALRTFGHVQGKVVGRILYMPRPKDQDHIDPQSENERKGAL
jgi:hypothetical protein